MRKLLHRIFGTHYYRVIADAPFRGGIAILFRCVYCGKDRMTYWGNKFKEENDER